MTNKNAVPPEGHDPNALPPRPDPQTGKPFPPHGLTFAGDDDNPEDDPGRETRLSRKPNPPPGMGPTLAWHRYNRRGRISLVLVSFGILAGGLAVISLIREGSLDILTVWPVWAVILVGTYLMSDPLKDWAFSAGADWVQVQYTRFGFTRKRYVKLYELTRIHCAASGITFHLDLNDAERFLSATFVELQRDRRIWDLVYNGIVHSVANGAHATNGAISALQLNQTPALRLAAKHKKQQETEQQDTAYPDSLYY